MYPFLYVALLQFIFCFNAGQPNEDGKLKREMMSKGVKHYNRELKSAMMSKDNKRYSLNLSENQRGRFLRVTRTHSMARHRKSPRQRNLMVFDPLTPFQSHQFDPRVKNFSVSMSTAHPL